jgi:ABC-2 type transport system permease protein
MDGLPAASELRVVGGRASARVRIVRLWEYRELLVAMVRRELKVRYKNSVLGFAWSLLNPLMYLAVFYAAFQIVLRAGIPSFPVFLVSGLLVWNLFLAGLSSATASITGSASLVNKVAFPREVLPLASVGAALVHFVLQFGVLVGVLLAARWHVPWSWVPLLVPATLTLVVLTIGIALLLAATNVYLRDTQHLVELGLLAWFWVTPVVYVFGYIHKLHGWHRTLFMANPVTPIVLVFQRSLYGKVAFPGGNVPSGGLSQGVATNEILPFWSMSRYLAYLGWSAALALVVIVVGYWAFGRLESGFAEEL